MGANSNGSVLEFDHVSVAFDDTDALKDVSFNALHGETLILFGTAGSGKTVTLKTALGLVKANSGSVRAFGQDVTRMDEEELFDVRSKIGMLFQESALFDSMTIAENVAYPLLNQRSIHCTPEEAEPKVREALRFVELEHTLEKFPSELSGGMRRRAAIARAVVTEPPLLLYDSPTAGLDPITANTILTLIIKQRDISRTTTLMVTHRYLNGHMMANLRYDPQSGELKPARDCGDRGSAPTRFLGFREGRLVFQGSQAELESSPDPYVKKFVRHNG